MRITKAKAPPQRMVMATGAQKGDQVVAPLGFRTQVILRFVGNLTYIDSQDSSTVCDYGGMRKRGPPGGGAAGVPASGEFALHH